MLIVLWWVSAFTSHQASAHTADNVLDQTPSSYAKLTDFRIHYKNVGTGDTALVFIHGWTADMNSWRSQAAAFADKIHLVLIDLPGHGKSDKPDVNYTMDLFAQSIHAVLADAGVKHAILVGHSMGTPVIRQFYRLYPELTRALVVVDGFLRRFLQTPEQVSRFVGRFSGPDFQQNYERFIASLMTEQTPVGVRKQLKETLPAAPQYAAVSAMKGMFDPAIWKDDPITVPLLVIVARSPNWPPDYEGYVRKLAPQAQYRVMEGVGHFLMLEKPQQFNDILADFLRKQGLLR